MALLLDTVAAFERLRKKFDPSEQRDASGKWSTSGGAAKPRGHGGGWFTVRGNKYFLRADDTVDKYRDEADAPTNLSATDKLTAWSMTSDSDEGGELRMTANVAAGNDPTAGMADRQKRILASFDYTPSEAEVASFRALQAKTAAAWDAEHPGGANLLRGIDDGPESQVLATLKVGDRIDMHQPLISATSDRKTADVFRERANPHTGEVSKGAIIVFAGVTGRHVLASQDLTPHLFGPIDHKETVLLGSVGGWVLQAKSTDADGIPVYTLKAADLRKAAEFDETKHPRAANGEFGSGGGGAKPKAKKPPSKELRARAGTIYRDIATGNHKRAVALLAESPEARQVLEDVYTRPEATSHKQVAAFLSAHPAQPSAPGKLTAPEIPKAPTAPSTVSHPELDPKIQAWVSESWGTQGTELRAAANIAAGQPATQGIPTAMHRSVPDPAELASTVAAFKTVQQQTAKAWDAKYPLGKALLRGISGTETEMLSAVAIGGSISVLQPLMSTTDDRDVAHDFATLWVAGAHDQEGGGPGIIRFIGVRGEHVFSSHEMSPENFAEYDDQRETIMLGTGSWKLTGKRRDRDGVTHFEFSPAPRKG